MADGDNHRRARPLPPPAFPPGGARRISVGWRPAASAAQLGGAFISPDDPMPERRIPGETFILGDEPTDQFSFEDDDAFIDPDEPIPFRLPRAATNGLPEMSADTDRGIVTGIGDDAHVTSAELALSRDPHVMDLVESVGKLAEALRRRGEAALRATPEMSRFEATVRAYCVGYLTGRRSEDVEG